MHRSGNRRWWTQGGPISGGAGVVPCHWGGLKVVPCCWRATDKESAFRQDDGVLAPISATDGGLRRSASLQLIAVVVLYASLGAGVQPRCIDRDIGGRPKRHSQSEPDSLLY